jgi:hypothetical protein
LSCIARSTTGPPPARPHPEVDASGGERLEFLVHLGDLERAVVVHQHGTGPEADPGGPLRGGGDEEFGVVAGPGPAEVVFGEPDAVVAVFFGVHGGGEGVGQGVRFGGPRGDGPEVDDGQFQVRASFQGRS